MPKISTPAVAVHIGDVWSHGHPVLDGKTVTGVILEMGQVEIRLDEGENILTFFPTDTVGVERGTTAEAEPAPAPKKAPMTQLDYARRRVQRFQEELWEKEKAEITRKSLAGMTKRQYENLEDDFSRHGEDLDDFIVAQGWNKPEPEPVKPKSFWKRLTT